MPRLMSVAFTEQAVRERRKTVTRRKGWLFLKPGDNLTLCQKVMGRKKGEPLVRIVDVRVVAVHREPLYLVRYNDELEREGCAHLTWREFHEKYFQPQGIAVDADVTRIEWEYVEAESSGVAVSPDGGE